MDFNNSQLGTTARDIFADAIKQYVENQPSHNEILHARHDENLQAILYHKCFIDFNQWRLEDEIRNPEIDPEYALKIKRQIDESNMKRTELVEIIDEILFEMASIIVPNQDASINTETPAWAIDRLSILMLKIYHAEQKSLNISDEDSLQKMKNSHSILCKQRDNLVNAINELMTDIYNGRKKMVLYKQHKMYGK